MKEWLKKTKGFFRTLLLEYKSPRQLAFAVSLGIFIGGTPLWGLHTLLSIGLAILFRLNKSAVVLASFISNPAIAPFLVFAGLQTGSLTLYGSAAPLSLHEIRRAFASPDWHILLHEYVKPYIVGSFEVALLLAFASYWITLWIARRAETQSEETGTPA